MKKWCLAVAMLLWSSMVLSEEWITEEVLKQLSEVRQELKVLQEEVKSLKGTIETQGTVQPKKAVLVPEVNIENTPVIGSDSAKVAIVEFSDYECPYCRRHFKQAYPDIKKHYIDTGKVKYYLKQFPLGFHANARGASIAALCADKQRSGEYWTVHDALFSGKTALKREAYLDLAKELKLDIKVFAACLDDSAMNARVEDEISQGSSYGVSGTPAFLIGRIEKGKVVNAKLLSGARAYASFSAQIDRLLAN